MPKHIRHHLVFDLRRTCDSLEEFTMFEHLSKEEEQELVSIKETLNKIREQIWDMCLALEKRTPDTVIYPRAPEPKTMFSWESHEAKVKELGKSKLVAKIEKMKSDLEDLKTKQNQIDLPIEERDR